MDSLRKIKREDIGHLFGSGTFSRGEEYFEEGFVSSVEMINNNTIVGTVLGNRKYRVTICLDSKNNIVCDCTCPCDFNCKHAAALLLKWTSIKKDLNNKSIKEEPIEKIISKKSKNELVSVVLELLNRNPELRSLIILRKGEVTEKIKTLFSNFWEWNEVPTLIYELELVLCGIQKNKNLWGKDLLSEIKEVSKIIVKGLDNVHCEDELGIFLQEWYETSGEVFLYTKPSKKEKIEFVKEILYLINKDDYGMDTSYEGAFVGMCENLQDINIIKEYYKAEEKEDEDYYNDFYLKLYEKAGEDDEFLKFSKEKGFSTEKIRKLIKLERFEEALEECNKQKGFSEEIENMKIEVLKKFKNKEEVIKSLFKLVIKRADIGYVKKLKNECGKKKWNEYLFEIISHAKKQNWNGFLSRIYFEEGDYKNAYKYAKDLPNDDYLEILAQKLSKNYPNLSCEILKNLCFRYINYGSGRFYKKAGKFLERIKRIDSSGIFFLETKEEIILKHKKKYSLINIIKDI